jgi:hypothetical protein
MYKHVLTCDLLIPHVSAELGSTGAWSKPTYDINFSVDQNALKKYVHNIHVLFIMIM